MKILLVIAATLLLLCANAQAQLRKCTGPDGKVTYSDVVCASNAATGSIKNAGGNSLDASGFRQEVQKNLAEKEASENRAEAVARQGPPQECKFAYFALGDEKGKRLAANAKAECLRNNEARLRGEPTSLEHYTFWNDHRITKSINRQGAITRANSDANAWATRNAIDNAATDIKNKSYTCTPNRFGNQLDCR